MNGSFISEHSMEFLLLQEWTTFMDQLYLTESFCWFKHRWLNFTWLCLGVL